MPVLDTGIHVFAGQGVFVEGDVFAEEDVDGRVKPGQDG